MCAAQNLTERAGETKSDGCNLASMGSHPMAIKIAVIVAAASTATLLCFLLMYSLIVTELRASEVPAPPKLSTHLTLEEEPVEIEQPEPERAKRQLPSEPPLALEGIPIEPQQLTVVVKSDRPSFDLLAKELVNDIHINFAPPSSDFVPLYVVQPVYPFSAVMKEIEGYVVVNFGVRENGTVKNPVVVESSPGSLFDEAALSAIDKFRFHPRTRLGDPLAVDDVRMRFVFELNETGADTRIAEQETP